jgi:hypothetical protein
MSKTHSPTPWRVALPGEAVDLIGKIGRVSITSSNVAYRASDHGDADDAEMALRAVNCHRDLVDTLQGLLKALASELDATPMPLEHGRILNDRLNASCGSVIRAVLAKVEEK